jgi:hypothetical protein
MNHLQQYEQRMQPERAQFSRNQALLAAQEGRLDDRALHALLLHFCALGFQMTKDVSRWITRAGERCVELGYPDLGNSLLRHAHHEAGHEQLFERDTTTLASRWNERFAPRVDAGALLASEPTAGVERYRALHENVFESDAPYCQIAIEYEIEAVSVREGGKLLRAIAGQLGADIVGCLSFVTEHVIADQGHTQWNARQLGRFLEAHPRTESQLVAAGTEALHAYGGFLDDCYQRVVS